jgi:type I restriction enzyme, S subunit
MSNGWPMVPLSEIAKPVSRSLAVVPGQSYRTIGVKWWGEGAYERDTIDGAQTAAKTLSLVKEGDLIINKIWVRHGSTAIATRAVDGCAASGEFPTFELDKIKVLPRWLHWQTKTKDFWLKCDGLSRGTSGKNRIKPDLFLTITVLLPPLPEQRRIVARIEDLAARIEEARLLSGQSAVDAEALLKSAIGSAFNGQPADGTLGEVLRRKPRNGRSSHCENSDGGTAILSLGAITGFRYRGSEFKRTSFPTTPDGHYWLKDGDLLIGRSNTPELVGHAAIYDGQPSPCIYPDLMMRLDVADELADKKCVWYWLQSPRVRDFIQSNAKGTSPTMKKIAQGTVMSIPFPSRLSLSEQDRIVAYLDGLQAKVDGLKRLQADAAAELDALLPSILDKAFKGEL